MTADDIIAAARACIGTPFRHQGRLPGVALDCAGLAVCVAREIGAEYIDQQGYSRSPSNNLLAQSLDVQPCLVKQPGIVDRRPGDLLLMRFGREPEHLAIYTGETIIHSYETVGKVCEHRMTPQWISRIVAVYRFGACGE